MVLALLPLRIEDHGDSHQQCPALVGTQCAFVDLHLCKKNKMPLRYVRIWSFRATKFKPDFSARGYYEHSQFELQLTSGAG